jgi:hypothetical protein
MGIAVKKFEYLVIQLVSVGEKLMFDVNIRTMGYSVQGLKMHQS